MSGVKRPSSIAGLSAALDVGKKASLPVVGDVSPSVKPVRVTVDFDRETHRYLKRFAVDSDADLMRVLRALVAEMQADDSLADRVRARVSS